MELRYLPTGFDLGRFIVHDWTFALTITRHSSPAGEFCVCWVGSFWMVTGDSGGWQSPDGIALGFDRKGGAILDGQWDSLIPGLALTPPGQRTRSPLARHIELAPTYAAYAELLLPAVDKAFALGADLEQTLAVLDADLDVSGQVADGMKLALGLLWIAEEERREASL